MKKQFKYLPILVALGLYGCNGGSNTASNANLNSASGGTSVVQIPTSDQFNTMDAPAGAKRSTLATLVSGDNSCFKIVPQASGKNFTLAYDSSQWWSNAHFKFTVKNSCTTAATMTNLVASIYQYKINGALANTVSNFAQSGTPYLTAVTKVNGSQIDTTLNTTSCEGECSWAKVAAGASYAFDIQTSLSSAVTSITAMDVTLNGAAPAPTPENAGSLALKVDSSQLSALCASYSPKCSIGFFVQDSAGNVIPSSKVNLNPTESSVWTFKFTNLFSGKYTLALDNTSLPIPATNKIIDYAFSPESNGVYSVSAGQETSANLVFGYKNKPLATGAFILNLNKPTKANLALLNTDIPVSVKDTTAGTVYTFTMKLGGSYTLPNIPGNDSLTVSYPGLGDPATGVYFKPVTVTKKITAGATITAATTYAVEPTTSVKYTVPVTMTGVIPSAQEIAYAGTAYTYAKGTIVNGAKLTFLAKDNVALTLPAPAGYNLTTTPNPAVMTSSVKSLALNYSQSSLVTKGTIYFHYRNFSFGLPASVPSQPMDEMNLANDRYTDLVLANLVGGVFYGHMAKEVVPGIQYNKDYMYGSIWGQLLQENLETGAYQPTNPNDQINVGANANIVMGSGQGGPYQLNGFAYAFPYDDSGASIGLANYVLLQKNIGFPVSQVNKYAGITPPLFNNKYYGAAATAFFHLNDMFTYYGLAKNTNWYAVPTLAPCLEHLTQLPGSHLDVILNVAYNAGGYSSLFSIYSTACPAANPSYVADIDGFKNVTGDSFGWYPYQVRWYADELYGKMNKYTGSDVHVVFNASTLRSSFAKMYTLLAYVDSTGKYKLISQIQADSAFDSAMVTSKVASQTVFDLTDTSLRNTFWSLLETATANLENSLVNPNFKNFMASTQVDLNVVPVPTPTTSATPTPSPSPVVYNTYPTGLGYYVAGSKVKGKDGNLYECKPSPYTPWCNGAARAYEPGTGSVWDQAWIKF